MQKHCVVIYILDVGSNSGYGQVFWLQNFLDVQFAAHVSGRRDSSKNCDARRTQHGPVCALDEFQMRE